MKLSVIFVAGAQAFTCGDRDPQPFDLIELLENNWWASTVESFNFASNNWKEFTDAVISVNRADHFCKNHNDIFKMDATIFREPFQRFDFDGDLEVSTEEFGNFEEHFALDSSHYDEFLANYWHIFDTDNSGTLNFEEFMYVFAAMADGFARLLPKVRKFISFLMKFSLQRLMKMATF